MGHLSLHILVLGSLTGTVLHTSFVSSIIQFRTLPRHMFGLLQSKQFPVYFGICAAAGSFLTISAARIAGFRSFSDLISGLGHSRSANQVALMGLATLGSLVNLCVVGPRSSSVMFQRHRIEKSGGEVPAALNKQFGRLHGISSILVCLTSFTSNIFYQ